MRRGGQAFYTFSPKQIAALTWWCADSPYAQCDAVICDGAVRSGKTLCLCCSFVFWAFSAFTDMDFAICGKTIASLRRNVVTPILPALASLGFAYEEKRSHNYMEVRFAGRRNRFYFFGGRDESSAPLIQGMTLGGVLFDEVALMPRSFVEQALARCSVEGSRFFFNCNPEHPQHWFYQEWIRRTTEKNSLYLHFTMEDNPSLTPAIRARYRSLYSGSFYERFIEGKWVAAQGLVYPFFSPQAHTGMPPVRCGAYYVSCDYGTVNPASFGLWGEYGGVWYRVAEYYYDSRDRGEQRTDEEYYAALEKLAGENPVEAVVVDPSAASFMACIRRHGRFRVIAAKNDVLDGIRMVADALKAGRIVIGPGCTDAIREFGLYRWDDGARRDAPRKAHDHAMDEIRYFVATVLAAQADTCGFALAVPRTEERGRICG